MERHPRIATHDGVVVAARQGAVTVKIEAVSACASCQAHAHCGFAESKEKTFDVPCPDWQTYAPGEAVTVAVDESRGLLAVWIAYLLPALILIALAVSLSALGLPEGVAALASLAGLGIYILVLYLRRQKVERRFTLTLSHAPNPQP